MVEKNRYQENFVYGKKILTLAVDLLRLTATVRFGNRKGRFVKKLPGETTTVFLLADESLAKIAAQKGKPITLTFDTANSNLKTWARSKKEELGFDSVEPNNEEAYRETVTKTYHP